jgi:predicted lipoprotein with Yx(FWY)xxD motif
MALAFVLPVMNMTRAWRATAITLISLAGVAACGGDDETTSETQADAPAAAAATTAAPAGGYDYGYGNETERAEPAASASGAALATAEGSLGTMVVDANGLTLYAFTPDDAGVPTCVDACADAWPPAFVDGEPTVEGVDASLVATVEHPAGGTQLVIDGHPLYTFAGDSAPGDVNGQGSGDMWFAVAPDGALIP